jgi:hypothetical protein
MRNFINSDSAVSESIGFALNLGIIIVSIALIYYAGVPIVEKSERTTHFQEMEKSFLFILQNIDKVGYDRAPIRNTELNIMGGTLRESHDSTIIVGDIADYPNYAVITLGSIEYSYDDKTVAYENGGVWTIYPDGGVVMFSNPTFSLGNVTTIPAFELTGEYEIGGEGTVRVTSSSDPTKLYFQTINPKNGNVPLEIQSNYYKGWADYLNQTGANNVTLDDLNKSVSANITANVVNVYHKQIQIQIQ